MDARGLLMRELLMRELLKGHYNRNSVAKQPAQSPRSARTVCLTWYLGLQLPGHLVGGQRREFLGESVELANLLVLPRYQEYVSWSDFLEF